MRIVFFQVSGGHDEGGKKEEHGDEHHVVKRAARHNRKWWKRQQRIRRANRAKAKRNVWKRGGFKGLLGQVVVRSPSRMWEKIGISAEERYF